MVQLTRAQPGRLLAVIIAFAILTLILVAFYWPFLTNAATFFIFDFTYGWQSDICYFVDELRRGHLPLWNPYVMCGVSELALAAPSPFHLLDWLFVLFGYNQGMAAMLLLNQLGAGVGTFLLLQSFRLGPLPAFIGAIAYALGGCMFSAQVSYPYQTTAALIPWCIWALKRIGQTDAVRPSVDLKPRFHRAYLHAALAAIFVGLMLQRPVAELYLPTLGALAVFSILDAAKLRLFPVKIIVLRLTAIGAGILLAMPVFLPLAQWTPLSPRATGLPIEEVLRWSAGWYDLLLLALAQPLGDMYNSSNPFIILPTVHATPLIASNYLGPVVIALAIRGLCALPAAIRSLTIAALAVITIAALGAHTPVVPALLSWLNIPFRFPVKLLYFLVAALVPLAAVGMDSMLRRTAVGSNAINLALWMVLGIGGAGLWIPDTATAVATALDPFHVELGLQATAALSISMLMACSLGLTTVMIMYLCDRGRMGAASGCSLLIILASCLFVQHAFDFSRHPGPADFFLRPVALARDIAALPKSATPDFMRIATMYVDPAKVMNASELDNWTVANYQHVRQMMCSPNSLDFRLGNIVFRSPGELDSLYRCTMHARREWENQSLDSGFASYCRLTACSIAITQMQNVSFNRVISNVPLLDKSKFQLRTENRDENYRLYSVLTALPRAYFARKVAWGKPHNAVVDLVAAADARSFDPEKLTILEHTTDKDIYPPLTITENDLSSSSITFADDQPEKIVLQVHTPVENWLVLVDQFYPGWKATIDGKPARIYPANTAFRSVLVPAGSHTIQFSFAPPVLAISLALAAVGSGFVAWMLLLAFKRRRV